MTLSAAFTTSLAFVLGSAVVNPQATPQDAQALATRLTSEGAAAFARHDVDALTASYATDAKIVSFLSKVDGGGITVETKSGAEEIRPLYERATSDKPIEASNAVEYAKLLGPDLLMIAGTFTISDKDAYALMVPFIQVRAREAVEARWRIISMEIFAPSKKEPDPEAKTLAERLAGESAETFRSKDADAMVGRFDPEATITLYAREEGRPDVSSRAFQGRDQIEGFYRQAFEIDRPLDGRNTIEYARLVLPDLLIFCGRFEMTIGGESRPPLPYSQVYARRNGAWKVLDIRAYAVPGD